jgi:hypothetical protein
MSDGGGYYQESGGAPQDGGGYYEESAGYYEEGDSSPEGGYYQDNVIPLPSDAVFVGHVHITGWSIGGEIVSRATEPIAAGRVRWSLSVCDSGGALVHSDGGAVDEIAPGDERWVGSDLPTLVDDTYAVALVANLDGTDCDSEPGWFRIVNGEVYPLEEEAGSAHVSFVSEPTFDGGAVSYSAVNDGTGPAAAGTVFDRFEISQDTFAMPAFTFQSQLVLDAALEVGATYTGRFDLPQDIPPGLYYASVAVDVSRFGPHGYLTFTI